VSVFGRVQHPAKVPPMGFQKSGDTIFLLGARSENLGGSVFLQLLEKIDTRIPELDCAAVAEYIQELPKWVEQDLIASATPILRGGGIMALLQSCFSGKKGASLTLPETEIYEKIPHFLFTEDLGVILSTDQPDALQRSCATDSLIQLGTVTDDFSLQIQHKEQCLLEQELLSLHNRWTQTLRNIF
jgi:phosphoribosylformylglycinamidine synthase